MDSIWMNDSHAVSFEHLSKNINTDVLIVGGGIAGLLCAYKLKNQGIDCVLIEADKICSGITKNTTAKITIGHRLLYKDLIEKIGEFKTKLYLEAQKLSLEEYNEICPNIDCDYEKQDSYVYSLNNREALLDEIKALNYLGIKATFSDCVNLPFSVAGAVRINGQAQFNPLKFLYKISKELHIYENTKAVEILPNKVITKCGEISFNKMIVATHFPIINKHGGYFLKLYQHRSYVLAIEGAPLVNGMYVDENEKGLSFRNYKNMLLIGGGSHRTGKMGGCWAEIEKFVSNHYKDAKIIGRWATQDCMTLDGMPYIGRYSKNTENLFVITGFNKWGMTSAMMGANILCDVICGKGSKYSDVVSPSRSIVYSQLAINAFESVVGFLKPTAPRCPHMGCALKYNRDEHSWDCPCHGSRFTEKGELIDNPATDDKKM